MKVVKGVYAVLFLAAILLGGCATQARYTHDEIKDYPLDVQEKIIKGEIMPGMTQQQVRYAWGSPSSVVTLEPEGNKQKEEWVYSSLAGVFKTRLTFIDGKLMYIISSEPGRVK
ncbi:MAG TPA: hypothetical protein VF790_03310 [Dissulfurispiraceae bacterium]